MSSSDLEIDEIIIFQKNTISQNNIISEISSKKEFLKLIEMTEFNDNFFYALFDPITNNNVFPQYSSDIEFFFEKINLFNDKPYGYQINKNIFENVLFENFNNPIIIDWEFFKKNELWGLDICHLLIASVTLPSLSKKKIKYLIQN